MNGEYTICSGTINDTALEVNTLFGRGWVLNGPLVVLFQSNRFSEQIVAQPMFRTYAAKCEQIKGAL